MHYENEGAGTTRDIKATATVTGIHYTLTGVCGEGTTNNGAYSGAITMTGTKTFKNHAGIWVE
jgi:hypothetical protein